MRLFFSRHLTSTDIGHYCCFAHTDEVEQRAVGRTGELTRAALDATGDIFCFHLVPHLLARASGVEIRFESHRTGTHTLGTADARLSLATTCFLAAHDEDTRGAIADGHIGVH